MDQINPQEGAAAESGAFQRFQTKLRALSERQDRVFRDILRKIEQRKLEEARRKFEE